MPYFVTLGHNRINFAIEIRHQPDLRCGNHTMEKTNGCHAKSYCGQKTLKDVTFEDNAS